MCYFILIVVLYLWAPLVKGHLLKNDRDSFNSRNHESYFKKAIC